VEPAVVEPADVLDDGELELGAGAPAGDGLTQDTSVDRSDRQRLCRSSPPDSVVGGTGQCTWNCASTAHPHPTNETVTPEKAGSIASEYGMSAPLVQSIASNESAFSNAAVSGAGARGVMQKHPGHLGLHRSAARGAAARPCLGHRQRQGGGGLPALPLPPDRRRRRRHRVLLLPGTAQGGAPAGDGDLPREIRDDQVDFAGGAEPTAGGERDEVRRPPVRAQRGPRRPGVRRRFRARSQSGG
jgi:hypothetical protein